MRRILNIFDTLRKIRPKRCPEPTSKTKTKLDFLEELKIDTTSSTSKIEPAQSTKDSWSNVRNTLHACRGEERPTINRHPVASTDSDMLVDVLEAQRFVSDIFVSMNVPHKGANEMADALIVADYMGQRSLGIHRLPSIAADLINLTVEPSAQPKVLSEREALALVDGQNAPGPVIANYCMELAMRKARKQAIGYVATRSSNNIGMASWYACQALTQRMIGLCMSNGPSILVPSGGTEPLLSSNLIACAAGSTREQFIANIDMSAYPIEQLELEYSTGVSRELPPKIAYDSKGRPTSCVADALKARRLRAFMPEHKGFGLAAMVDVLCGVMTGARYATQLRGRDLFSGDTDPANLGQIYIAIDPMYFCVSFEDRLADFYQLLRNVMPCDTTQPSLIPGDQELQHMQMVDDQGGLVLSSCTLGVLKDLGEYFNIDPIKFNSNTK